MTLNTDKDKFPAFLLQSQVSTRQAYFFNKTIGHPRLEGARKQTLALIDKAAGPDIIIVTGPTGVGKTTLAGKIEQSLITMNMPRMEQDKSFLPVVRLDAVPPEGTSKFDWKDFYIRVLQAFREPCIAQKQLFETDIHMEQPISPIYSMNSLSALRRAVEKTMKMRGVNELIIDEANHLLMVDPKYLRRQFEIIKSLSQKCNVTIILIGTYDLLQILAQSAQLVRRSRVVHMSRYDDYIPKDKLAFMSALYTFQRHMPFEVEPDLVSHLEDFYLKSAGCIGILKKWLDNVVKHGLDANMETIDWAYADNFSHANKDISTVLEEAFLGESKLKDINVKELREMLEKHHIEINENNSTTDSEKTSTQPATPPKKNNICGQVGKRKPKRDPVGRQGALGL